MIVQFVIFTRGITVCTTVELSFFNVDNQTLERFVIFIRGITVLTIYCRKFFIFIVNNQTLFKCDLNFEKEQKNILK